MPPAACTSVHLTGGEPIIHPDFVEVLVLARKLGMRTSVGTIGTMLCREEFARRAVPQLDEGLFRGFCVDRRWLVIQGPGCT